MKYLLAALFGALIVACSQQPVTDPAVENRITELEARLARAYKPGFGEFMSAIQAHHAKLWWAGQYRNWPLADFEIQEINESVEDIRTYQTERPESKLIGMLLPAIDSVNAAIRAQSPAQFQRSFALLTQTCNDCHHATKFAFNVVRIPDAVTFGNQDFRPAAR